MLTTSDLLIHLRHHIGKRNGITARDLVKKMQRFLPEVTERELRAAVQRLREEGHHVCAHPRQGYYLAETPEELDETCQFLHDRAMASLKQIAAMKRVSVPDLRGQLRLPN